MGKFMLINLLNPSSMSVDGEEGTANGMLHDTAETVNELHCADAVGDGLFAMIAILTPGAAWWMTDDRKRTLVSVSVPRSGPAIDTWNGLVDGAFTSPERANGLIIGVRSQAAGQVKREKQGRALALFLAEVLQGASGHACFISALHPLRLHSRKMRTCCCSSLQ
jgi:hypothetical protein